MALHSAVLFGGKIKWFACYSPELGPLLGATTTSQYYMF